MNSLCKLFLTVVYLLSILSSRHFVEALQCYSCTNCNSVGGSGEQCPTAYTNCAQMTISTSGSSLVSRFCAPSCPSSSGSFTMSCCTSDYCNSGSSNANKVIVNTNVFLATTISIALAHLISLTYKN